MWHSRLGHPFVSRMNFLHQFIPELTTPDIPCAICPLAKQRKLPFPKNNHLSDCPFDLIHYDVWGPDAISTVKDYKFLF